MHTFLVRPEYVITVQSKPECLIELYISDVYGPKQSDKVVLCFDVVVTSDNVRSDH